MNGVTIDACPETYVLFSALQLCESQVIGGLTKLVPSRDGDEAPIETNETFRILVSSLDEIITGLEFDHTEAEKEYWKFKVTGLLTALAVRKEFAEDVDLECDLYLMLADFPEINISLLLELIHACKLEFAFVKLIETLDFHLELKVLAKYIDCYNNGHIKREASLFDMIVRYVFFNGNGMLVKLVKCTDSEISTFGYTVLEKILLILNPLFHNTEDNNGRLSQHCLVTFFIGLLNLMNIAHLLPMYTCDNLRMNTNCDHIFGKLDGNPNANIENTNHFVQCKDKYNLSIDEYKDVMQHVLVKDVQKRVRETRLPGQTIPQPIIDKCLEIVSSILDNDVTLKAVNVDLKYFQELENIALAFSQKWRESCAMTRMFEQMNGNIRGMLERPAIKAYLKSRGRTQRMRDIQGKLQAAVLQDIFAAASVTDRQQFLRALYVIDEQLDGWTDSFTWLLTQCDSDVSDPRWIACLESHAKRFTDIDNAKSLWQRIESLSKEEDASSSADLEQKQPSSNDVVLAPLRRLFLDVFSKFDLKNQNSLLRTVLLESDVDTVRVFGADETRVFSRLTVLLNRMVVVVAAETSSVQCTISAQIAALALQCPRTVVTYLVRHASQNAKQCDVIVTLLRHLSALVAYICPESTESRFSECVKDIVGNSGDLSEKEQRSVLYFAMKITCAQETINKNDSGENTSSITNNEKENDGVLINYSDVITQCVFPFLCDVTKYDDDTDMFLCDSFVFCLQVTSSLLQKHSSSYLTEQQWQSLNVIPMLYYFVELLVSCDEMSTLDLVHLTAEGREYIIDILQQLQALVATNAFQMQISDIRWLANQMANFPWHYKGYLLALHQTVQKMAHPSNPDSDALVFHVPGVLSSIATIPQDGRLTLDPKSIPNGTDTKWTSALKVAIINDDLCRVMSEALHENVVENDYLEFTSALLQILPFSMEKEWVRAGHLIDALCARYTPPNALSHPQGYAHLNGESLSSGYAPLNGKSLSSGDAPLNGESLSSGDAPLNGASLSPGYEPSNAKILSSTEAQACHTDSVATLCHVTLIVLDTSPEDLGVELHLVKCFTHALHALLYYEENRKEIDSNSTKPWEANVGSLKQNAEAQFLHLLYMNLIVNKISDEVQEQVIGLLLNLVERFAQTAKQIQKSGASDSSYGTRLRRLVTNLNSKSIQNVMGKKLSECSLT